MNTFQCGIIDQTMNSFMSQLDKIRLFTALPARSHRSLQQYMFAKAVSCDHRYKESSDVKS